MEDLIPRTIPALQGFDVAGVNEASFEVGGDYYEFIPLPDDRWGIVIADVVGKGIGAALLVSAIRASMYALVGRELATRAVMRRANRFFHDSVEEGKYVTLFYAVLDVFYRRRSFWIHCFNVSDNSLGYFTKTIISNRYIKRKKRFFYRRCDFCCIKLNNLPVSFLNCAHKDIELPLLIWPRYTSAPYPTSTHLDVHRTMFPSSKTPVDSAQEHKKRRSARRL